MNNIDSSKTTYLYPPEDQINYEFLYKSDLESRDNWNNDILTSLRLHGVLNVCQILSTGKNKKVSIPMYEQNIGYEKLTAIECISDIVLYQLLTGDIDKGILPQYDYRSQDPLINKGHNCIMYSSGSYSIFDIHDFKPSIDTNDVLIKIIQYTIHLYESGYMKASFSEEWTFFDIENIDGRDAGFFIRMKNKVEDLMLLYDGNEGKKLFMMQIAHVLKNNSDQELTLEVSQIYDKYNGEYNSFMQNLFNINHVISQEDIEEIIGDFLSYDSRLLINNIKYHSAELGKSMISLCKSVLWKIKEILK